MRDIGLVNFGEPFTKLFTQGMLLNESFYRDDESGKKRWFYPSEVDVRYDDKGHPVGATAREDGQPVMLGGIEKMSKSKNNVVEPRDIIAKFGADTARLFTMFAGPPDQSAAWSDSGAEGAIATCGRLWSFAAKPRRASARRHEPRRPSAGAKDLRREVHTLLRQISHDYDRLQYNTVVSGAMKLLNALEAPSSADTPADDAALREGSACCCAPCTRPRRTSRTRCGTSSASGRQRRAARHAVAAGRRGRAGAGRDRVRAAGQRQAARCDQGARRCRQGADRDAALASPDFSSSPKASTRRRSSSCRAALVNVVV
jgi:hypothetical protein